VNAFTVNSFADARKATEAREAAVFLDRVSREYSLQEDRQQCIERFARQALRNAARRRGSEWNEAT
jgi:hypothetical protein